MGLLTRSFSSPSLLIASASSKLSQLKQQSRLRGSTDGLKKLSSVSSLQKPRTRMYSAIVQRRVQMSQQATPQNATASSSPPPAHLMLVSDIDLTLFDHDDASHAALLNFNCLWAAEYAHNSHLVYSTGRTMQRFSALQKEAPLLTPDVLILSVGTEIRSGSTLEIDTEWLKELDDGWNREVIVDEALKISGLRFQGEPDQGPHKVSFKVHPENAEGIQQIFSARLLERGLNVKLLYSSGEDLDVLPHKAGKGPALAYLLRKLHQEGGVQQNVLVCGDSGNDIDLFTVDGVHGVLVSNAKEELIKWYQCHNSNKDVFHSNRRCAAAVVHALQYFQFGPHLSPLDVMGYNYLPPSGGNSVSSPGSVHREIVEFNVFMIKWLRGQIADTDNSFHRLSSVISDCARMIYPWGIESSFGESIDAIRLKHGSLKDVETRVWFDLINVQQLADGVYLATWQPWEQVAGGPKKGYFATAILVAKAGNPNGLEWKHFHETTRKAN